MREFWDRAGWLVALAVILIVVASAIVGPAQLWCGPPDEKCFREWFSALNGWVAAIGAAIAAYYLVKQIDAANRHQRENVELQIAHHIQMARKMGSLMLTYDQLLAQLVDDCRVKSNELRPDNSLAETLSSVAKLLGEVCENEIWNSYDEKIGLPLRAAPGFIMGFVRQVAANVEALEVIQNYENLGLAWRQHYLNAAQNLKEVQASFDIVRKDAEAFISRWESRIA